jgi:hypothetical protein
MTNESDNQNDAEGAVTPERDGLWKDVRFWFGAILSVFGDVQELRVTGLTRSLGVKLCNWLWGVEGAIRRLIIAEALKLDPSSLAKTSPRPESKTGATPDQPPTSRKRRPSFRIFGFNRQGEPQSSQASATGSFKAGLPDRWHIPFPADRLLSIGPRSKRTRNASGLRRINPLDRRGRISRFDPDYVGEEEDYETALLGLSPHRPARPSCPRPEPRLAQERPDYLSPRSDPFDWRRIEEEWKQVIPAPHLAARVFALASIMDNKDRAVARVARLFARRRNLMVDIVGQPPPELAWPRRARPIYRSRDVEEMARLSHAGLWRLDTS